MLLGNAALSDMFVRQDGRFSVMIGQIAFESSSLRRVNKLQFCMRLKLFLHRLRSCSNWSRKFTAIGNGLKVIQVWAVLNTLLQYWQQIFFYSKTAEICCDRTLVCMIYLFKLKKVIKIQQNVITFTLLGWHHQSLLCNGHFSSSKQFLMHLFKIKYPF